MIYSKNLCFISTNLSANLLLQRRLWVLRYEGLILITPGLAEDFDCTDQCGISADGSLKLWLCIDALIFVVLYLQYLFICLSVVEISEVLMFWWLLCCDCLWCHIWQLLWAVAGYDITLAMLHFQMTRIWLQFGHGRTQWVLLHFSWFYIPFEQPVGVRPVWGLCFGLKVAAGQNDITGEIEIMNDI